MSQDETIAMAKEARLFSKYSSDAQAVLYDSHSADIQRFAALVAAKEREACLEVAEMEPGLSAHLIAQRIRARGTKEGA